LNINKSGTKNKQAIIKIEYALVKPGTGTLSTKSFAFSKASGPFNLHCAVPQLENRSLLI